MKKETILAIAVAVIMISGSVYFIQGEKASVYENSKPKEGMVDGKDNNNDQVKVGEVTEEFISCLKDAGVVIYGSKTCPACADLEKMYGGYEMIKPIYLDCSGLGSAEENERCMEEKQTMYVPEIQINGELLEERRSPQCLSDITGCEL